MKEAAEAPVAVTEHIQPLPPNFAQISRHLLVRVGISGWGGIRCPVSAIQTLQLYGFSHILKRHLATLALESRRKG